MLRRSLAAVGTIVAVLVIVGCGGRGDAPEVGPSAAPSSSPPASAPDEPIDDARRAPQGVGSVTLVVTTPDGRTVEWCVWLADTTAARSRGLMFVEDPDLGGKAGMVFVYDDDTSGGFWMRNTRLPLSIAYLAADGSLVSTADMEPCPADAETCPTYPPAGPYRMALEVPAGQLEAVGVVEGSRVALGGDCAT